MEIIEGTDNPGTKSRRSSDSSMVGAQIGLLVKSRQGRDKGRYYLVVGIESETIVRVADGDLRRVESPKRKNIRHIKSCGLIASEIQEKAIDGKRITNADVRKGLKSLLEELESEIYP